MSWNSEEAVSVCLPKEYRYKYFSSLYVPCYTWSIQWHAKTTKMLKRNTKFSNFINYIMYFLLFIMIHFQSDILELFRAETQVQWIFQECFKSALFSDIHEAIRICGSCEFKRRYHAWKKQDEIYCNKVLQMQVENISKGLVLSGLVKQKNSKITFSVARYN